MSRRDRRSRSPRRDSRNDEMRHRYEKGGRGQEVSRSYRDREPRRSRSRSSGRRPTYIDQGRRDGNRGRSDNRSDALALRTIVQGGQTFLAVPISGHSFRFITFYQTIDLLTYHWQPSWNRCSDSCSFSSSSCFLLSASASSPRFSYHPSRSSFLPFSCCSFIFIFSFVIFHVLSASRARNS
jgi:hypothetical protein